MVGRRRLARRNEHELVGQVERVLDDADDLTVSITGLEHAADVHVERLRRVVGDGRLVGTRGVAADTRRSAEWANAPCGSWSRRSTGATDPGTTTSLVTDHLDRAERCPGGVEIFGELRRVAVDRDQVAGAAQLGLHGRRGVGADGDADDRRSRPPTSAASAPAAAGAIRDGTAGPTSARALGGRSARRWPIARRLRWLRSRRRAAGEQRLGSRGPARCCRRRSPSRRKTTRSAHEASCASWVTTTPATPRLHAVRTSRITASPFSESSAPDGSSASNSRRSPTIARATATRCRSPPDSSSGNRSALSSSPRSPSTSIADRRATFTDTPSSSRGKATFSAALSPARRLKSWNT